MFRICFWNFQIINLKISRNTLLYYKQGHSKTIELASACAQNVVNYLNERTWHALINWQVHMRPDEKNSK